MMAVHKSEQECTIMHFKKGCVKKIERPGERIGYALLSRVGKIVDLMP